MLIVPVGNEHTFLFVEYLALWEKQANIMATVDERNLWLERKQTTARHVRYIYNTQLVDPKVNLLYHM